MKHLALAVAVVWLAVMVWIAAWLLAPPAPVLPPPAAAATGSAVAQLAAAVDRGRHTLDSVVGQSRFPLASQTPVIAVPPLAGMPAASSTLAAAGPATEASRTLSMIYTADGFQRAVIDGQYVAPGQRLADGARVDSITADHVVLRDRQGRQVLRLGHPRQALNGRTPGPAGPGLAQR